MKGTARRVVVVKSPDPKIFEEAIFIVRDEFLRTSGVSSDDLLKEATRAADGYITATLGREERHKKEGVVGWFYAAAGAAITGLTWFAMHMFAII